MRFTCSRLRCPVWKAAVIGSFMLGAFLSSIDEERRLLRVEGGPLICRVFIFCADVSVLADRQALSSVSRMADAVAMFSHLLLVESIDDIP